MSSWSHRRKYTYLTLIIAFIVVVVCVPAFYLWYTPPTCFDGKQNGGERGSDCGGSCERLCPADFAQPLVFWSHAARVTSGVYNLLAYVQNPNQVTEGAGSYIFSVYDADGLLITEETGTAFIPAGQRFAVFKPTIQTGDRIPFRTTFEFTGDITWRAGTPLQNIRVDRVSLDSTEKRLSARITNTTVGSIRQNLDIIAVLYDTDGNRVNFSKTIIDRLNPQQERTVFFTWQEPLGDTLGTPEIIVIDNP